MNIALKAQSQCRWTLKALQAMNDPRAAATKASPQNSARAPDSSGGSQEFFEQTIANGKT